jgi:hypothetical protein
MFLETTILHMGRVAIARIIQRELMFHGKAPYLSAVTGSGRFGQFCQLQEDATLRLRNPTAARI